MSIHPAIIVALLILLNKLPAAADQYIVNIDGSGDYLTIQDAVDAASSGDAIIVAAGTYISDPRSQSVVHVHNKSLRIFSNAGPTSTKISGQDAYRCVLVTGNEGHVVRLEGFQILHGEATWYDVNGDGESSPDEHYGGGVLVIGNCHIKLSSCWFFDNNSEFHGAGLSTWNCSAELTQCLFRNNTCQKGSGGGIRCDLSDVQIDECMITSNHAQSGGGLYSNQCDLEVTGCYLGTNRATSGGGAQVFSGSVVFDYCQIINNLADHGGGIQVEQSQATLTDCLLSGNEALIGGGLFLHDNCTVHIRASDFQINSADKTGSAMNCGPSTTVSIEQSRFCNNGSNTINGSWIDAGNNVFTDQCTCVGDLNGNDVIEASDLLLLLESWDTSKADLNGDGITNVDDVLVFIQRWGPCP